jgi:hypothetical protein
MRPSQLNYFFAIFSLLLVLASSVSCTERMLDTKVNRFYDAIFGAMTTGNKLEGPFSVKLIVNLKVLVAGSYTKDQPTASIPIKFSARTL